jgi:hypothetical protein
VDHGVDTLEEFVQEAGIRQLAHGQPGTGRCRDLGTVGQPQVVPVGEGG